MKNILFTLALLISFSSFGQDGIVIDYYESGAIKSEGYYEDGIQQGEEIQYYENGEYYIIKNYE